MILSTFRMPKQTETFHCPCCLPLVKAYSTKNGLLVHVKSVHPHMYNEVRESFSDTPENRFPCKHCGKMLYGNARRHEKNCAENPDKPKPSTYTDHLQDFLTKVGKWATTIGHLSRTISIKTWDTYKVLIRKIVCHSALRHPSHLIAFASLEFSSLPKIDEYIGSQPQLSVPVELQTINAYLKLVHFIMYELDKKIDLLGNTGQLTDIKRYLDSCVEKASQRLKEVKKKLPLDKEQRNWQKRTMGAARGSYTELDFENCNRIFSMYLRSHRREQVLSWFESNGFVVNAELGINSESDMRLFMAADLFFHGVGARAGAVINLTYEEIRQTVDHGDCVELRSHSFKTASTFGNSPFVYPKREFQLLAAYAAAFPLAMTGGHRNTEGRVFADSEGRPITNYYLLMRQIRLCVPEVALPSSHDLCPQDYRHYIATLTFRHGDDRLIRAAARSATHSVQMHQRYQHPEVAAADYRDILDLVNKQNTKKKRKRIVVLPSSSSSSSSDDLLAPPAPFTIGAPPNVCASTGAPDGLTVGDYYDCVACDLEEVCPVCIERCHDECPIKSLRGFGFYHCQCGPLPTCTIIKKEQAPSGSI